MSFEILTMFLLNISSTINITQYLQVRLRLQFAHMIATIFIYCYDRSYLIISLKTWERKKNFVHSKTMKQLQRANFRLSLCACVAVHVVKDMPNNTTAILPFLQQSINFNNNWYNYIIDYKSQSMRYNYLKVYCYFVVIFLSVPQCRR